MEIIRIPTAYALQMKHLSDSDISYVMKSIFLLSSGEVVELEDNMRGGIVQSIWRETVQLENKARAKKGEKTLCYQLATLGATPSSKTCDQTKPNQINPIQTKPNQNTDISIDIGEQALVPIKKEIEKIDSRNIGTQRIIDMVKDQVFIEGYLYDNNKEERNRATIISKRQSDWGLFIKDISEEREEEIIRSIISYSNKNEYSAKIRSVRDFHEKWKKVANTMKQAVVQVPESRVF